MARTYISFILNFLVLTALLFVAPLIAAAPNSVYKDIIFDFDQTAGYMIHGNIGGSGDPLHEHSGTAIEATYERPDINKDGSPVLNFDGNRKTTLVTEKFRLYAGFVELLQELKRHRSVRVSFFSAGSTIRLLTFLTKIKLPDGRSASEIVYRTLGEEDLTRVGNVGRFREMFRKDLRKVSPDLQNVIMLDDVNFALDGQKQNLLLFVEDFPYPERRLHTEVTKELITKESGKIREASRLILELLERSTLQNESLIQVLSQIRLNPDIIVNPISINTKNDQDIKSCTEAFR